MTRKVLISGYHGFNNVGDEAILESLLQILRRAAAERGASLEITVLSADPRKTTTNNGVKAVGRTRFLAILPAIWSCDLFISGGGGLLQDRTGYGLSVLYYLGLVFLARLMGKPIAFYAHGVGPITKKINRLITRWIVNGVDLITVRDADSKKELLALGVTRPPLQVTVDPAFYLRPLPPGEGPGDKVEAILAQVPRERPLLGISVREWQAEKGLLQEVARAADLVAGKLGAGVVFVPMFPSQDLPASRKAAAAMQHESYVVEDDLTPRELLSLFSHFDLFIGVRLHSLIFASIVGTPMVGICYDPKVDSFLSRLELDAEEKVETLTAESLYLKCMRVWESREAIKPRLLELAEDFRGEAISCGNRIYHYFFGEESGEESKEKQREEGS